MPTSQRMETSRTRNGELAHVAEMPKGWTQRMLAECAEVNAEQLGKDTDPNFQLEYLDIAAMKLTYPLVFTV